MSAEFTMFASAHISKYCTTEEDLALVRVKNSSYGALNEKVAFRKEFTVDDIMS
jgi:acetyl-CoA C-acetyltransferase